MDEYRVYRTFLKIMVPCANEKKMSAKSKRKKKEKSAPVKKRSEEVEPRDESADNLNFGGLPPRNLKKNLGC